MADISEIWVISFGAIWEPGVGWKPSYLTGRELSSRRNVALDRVALFAASHPPYPTGEDALLVGFVGEAIVSCHLTLGWALPSHLVDLRVEFRNLANGQTKPCGDGMVGALIWFGLHASEAVYRRRTRVDGGRDVTALEHLFLAMRPELDLPRAILRGRYLIALAKIETTGIPVDVVKFGELKRNWRNIMRMMGTTVFGMRLDMLAIGLDGRHRAQLRPFCSRTGRNQPRNTEYLLSASSWLRRLIKPETGTGLAIIDWSSQEFGIAAALSDDQRMLADYQSGDPYQALADRYCGERAVFKACALGVLNGIGASGLARQVGCNAGEARLLLQEHRAEFPAFWRWSDGVESHAFLHGMLQSTFGWRIAVIADTNPRFLRNFPLQANAAEMLRLACCLATERGVTVCAPNHDALLIEAPLDELSDAVEVARTAMAEASQIVLDGFQLRTSVTIIRHPEHNPHSRSDGLWADIQRCLADLAENTAHVHERDTSCAPTSPRPVSLYVL